MSEPKPTSIGLYLHLPWCLSKCPYCDFNSHTLKPEHSLGRYTAALCRDIETTPARERRPLASVFIGGGTPSVFAPESIQKILNTVAQVFTVSADAEITMEANPGSLGRYRFEDYAAAGINRLSLGAQSFDAESLARLGRVHGPREIGEAFDAARRAGIANINLDLMFGLPGQTPDMAARDVEAAVALGAEHVSYYELTLEPNTAFFADPPDDLPGDDDMAAIHDTGIGRLEDAGYGRYEVSAFAKPGAQCRHNLNYWRYGDYLGCGAGAHGKWTDARGVIWRDRKTAHPESFMQALERGDKPGRAWTVGPGDVKFEFALNALRLSEGFSASEFEARTALPFATLESTLLAAKRDGLMTGPERGKWRPSTLGYRFLNDLQSRFLPSGSGGARASRAVS